MITMSQKMWAVAQVFETLFGRHDEQNGNEIFLASDDEQGADYFVSYIVDEELFVVSLGVSFDAERTPEQIISSLQQLIEYREHFIAAGFDAKSEQEGPGIYDYKFSGSIPIDNLYLLHVNLGFLQRTVGIQKYTKTTVPATDQYTVPC